VGFCDAGATPGFFQLNFNWETPGSPKKAANA
jgi:hypothetical protein